MHWRMQLLNRAVCQRPVILESKSLMETKSSKISEGEVDDPSQRLMVHGDHFNKHHGLYLSSKSETSEDNRRGEHADDFQGNPRGYSPSTADVDHRNRSLTLKASRIHVSLPSSRDPGVTIEQMLKPTSDPNLAHSYAGEAENSEDKAWAVREHKSGDTAMMKEEDGVQYKFLMAKPIEIPAKDRTREIKRANAQKHDKDKMNSPVATENWWETRFLESSTGRDFKPVYELRSTKLEGDGIRTRPRQNVMRVQSARTHNEKHFPVQDAGPARRKNLIWTTNHDQTKCGWEASMKNDRSVAPQTHHKAATHVPRRPHEPVANAEESKDVACKKVNVKPFDSSLGVTKTARKALSAPEKKGRISSGLEALPVRANVLLTDVFPVSEGTGRSKPSTPKGTQRPGSCLPVHSCFIKLLWPSLRTLMQHQRRLHCLSQGDFSSRLKISCRSPSSQAFCFAFSCQTS
mmetsp:Transcript_24148/g.78659  ORF Transcript_24148/g.78659 Transcript_24148/m.78659 type:complete len:461 (-) Transcript_24148:465-1847(-)